MNSAFPPKRSLNLMLDLAWYTNEPIQTKGAPPQQGPECWGLNILISHNIGIFNPHHFHSWLIIVQASCTASGIRNFIDESLVSYYPHIFCLVN